jgi:hypothetical protein
MLVEYDTEIPPPREHPWTVVVANPEARYWDFKASPEQVPLVLEDFKPWSHYPAIPRFYELLTWLNGSGSIFESNDCGLRPPRRDEATPEIVRQCFTSDPIVVHGRLTILVRDLTWNASTPTVDGLKTAIHDCLRNGVPNFPSVVMVGEWEHLFTLVNKEGRAVSLRFWAWGDDEAMAMANLNSTFGAIHKCLKGISDGAKNTTSKSYLPL